MKNKKQSGKKAKSGAEKSLPPVMRPKQKKKLSRRGRILLFILIGALSFGALVGGFFGIRALLGYGRDFDYLKTDLSRYVKLSAEDLKNIKMTVRVDKPTEEDVEREILALLVGYKTLADGESDPDAVIQNGSVVKFYYSGYLLGANGEREYFSGGSNLSAASASTLTIGSAEFYLGFEEGLIGIRPSETEIPTVIKEGTLSEGDVVYANIVGFHPDGRGLDLYGQRIELTPALDDAYGDGFYELLLGAELDTQLVDKTLVLPSEDGDFGYTSIIPLYKTEGGKAHTVETYVPWSQLEDAPNLAGKTAYFDVYIQDTTTYDVPEFTDAFLTDTVGIITEKLDEYDGATLTEKYRNYVRKELEKDYETRLSDASATSFFEKIKEIATVKRVPRAAVLEIYDDYIADMKVTHEEYLLSTGYTEQVYPFDTFAVDYLRLEEGTNYKKHVRELAKETAAETLVTFYAIQLMGVAPSDSELYATYDEILWDLAEQYSGIDESYYESQPDEAAKQEAYAEYVKTMNETKAALVQSLGEEYLLESAYYNSAFPKLLALIKVNYVGRGHNG